MTAKDWFGVVVRGAGLYMLIAGIGQGVAVFAERELSTPDWGRAHVLYLIFYLVLGMIALRGGNMIVRFAYPDDHTVPTDGDDKSQPS